ncbi:cytochrome P450 [Streptomyces nitrosporeus]|uniref:Cytochrome P450 n=1 Tax=Streptomyces nitrosporeus TaxID=28894 RepID=A0A5J6F5J3_9ACTN|nr:cytochrome P450 [Streptomyces nitrosporeus]QEU71277.1 cytochrome P450 [Streptomyces nitrosporeus]GGY99200.1 cytochrome P450 [Streptomyces nitrosporeus]
MAHEPVSRCPVLDVSGRSLHADAAALRSEAPAVRVLLPGGVTAWAVTRYDVIRALTSDPRVSRDFARHWPGRSEVPDGWPLAAVTFQQNFLNTYGAEHRMLRGLVAPSFSPRRVSAMRPGIEAVAERLTNAWAALGPGEATDLRATYALPLTMTVICELFGVPEHLRGPLGAAIDRAADTAASPEQALAVHAEIDARLDELVSHKRAHPGADLTSDLLMNPAEDGSVFTEETLKGTLFLMIGAGYETTVHLITSAAHALLTGPDVVTRIRKGELRWADVVEETLRLQGPIMYLPLRYAVEDIDLGEGVLVRQGDAIAVAFAAAGRDPDRHPKGPDDFDPSRADKTHLAFGHGPHFCLGAHLARLEAEVALRTLFTRLPRLALASPERTPDRLPSFILNGLTGLPVVPVPAA